MDPGRIPRPAPDESTSGRLRRIEIRLDEGDVKALDRYLMEQAEPRPSRSELVRRVVVDRLVHEGHLPPSRAFTGQGRQEGLRPEELNSENDD
jgi:hypothetical protein